MICNSYFTPFIKRKSIRISVDSLIEIWLMFGKTNSFSDYFCITKDGREKELFLYLLKFLQSKKNEYRQISDHYHNTPKNHSLGFHH